MTGVGELNWKGKHMKELKINQLVDVVGAEQCYVHHYGDVYEVKDISSGRTTSIGTVSVKDLSPCDSRDRIPEYVRKTMN